MSRDINKSLMKTSPPSVTNLTQENAKLPWNYNPNMLSYMEQKKNMRHLW